MKIYQIFIVLLIASAPLLTNAQEKENKDKVYEVVGVKPEYPGGTDALRTFLASQVEYPAEAKKKGIKGKVFVSFIIDKDGSVIEPKVVKSVDPLLDKEAIRVFSEMPKWKPGKNEGKFVKVTFTVPINFALKACNSKTKSN